MAVVAVARTEQRRATLDLATLYREERLVPKSLELVSPGLREFTLAFSNPDGSPYDFQGAGFGLTVLANGLVDA